VANDVSKIIAPFIFKVKMAAWPCRTRRHVKLQQHRWDNLTHRPRFIRDQLTLVPQDGSCYVAVHATAVPTLRSALQPRSLAIITLTES
jgi:hypothetical protein